MKHLILPAALAALAACSGPAPTATNDAAPANVTTPTAIEAPVATPSAAASATPAPAGTAKVQKDYLGRWIGVEGMYLVVTPEPGGGVGMEMQYDLDHKGKYSGSVTAEGLRFMRNGVAETAVPSDGDATGLKWLAGKKDCLTVKPGEGYCRA